MRRKLLFAVMMFAFSWANSQFQDINDPVFEDELIRLGYDSNLIRDGVISIADAQAITFLNLSGHPVYSADTNLIGVGITDLTGIKAFSNLEVLWVHGNDLTALDLEGMSTLKDVRAFINDLETININGLTNLEIIGLNVNNLTDINVSTNTSLKVFDIAQNNLSNFDITGLNNLEEMNVLSNPILTCIQVQDATTALSLNSNAAFRKNGTTQFSANCNLVYDVQVSVPVTQEIDANGFYVVRAANQPAVLQFNAVDANGQDLNTILLSDYDLTITTLPDPNRNPAAGGNTTVAGIDFELLNGLSQNVAVQNGQIDFSRPIQMQGDSAFEADEYFIVQVTSNDPDVNLSNSTNGVVTFPVRIIDNEQTNINLEVIDNGIEGSQNVKLRITSSLQNDTGASMPFEIVLQSGSATLGSDFQLANTTIQLPNGQSSVDVDITVNNDTDATEGTENFNATVSYTGDIDTNRINIVSGSVTPTITEAATNQVTINANLSISGPEPFSIDEGSSFQINFFGQYNQTPANPTFDINYSINGSTATAGIDFNTPDISVTVNNDPLVDATTTFNISSDYYADANEFITLTFPKDPNFDWANADANGDLIFVININNLVPTELFKVDANLIGAGNAAGFSIEEGKSFTLEFEPKDYSFEAVGDTFSFPFQALGNPEDFTVNETEGTFIVNDNFNPDGLVTFAATTDNFSNENETISITLPKPTDYFTWEGAANDGSLTFQVAITDGTLPQGVAELDAEIKGDVQTDMDGNYFINEGGTIEIWVEATNANVTNGQNFSFDYEVATSGEPEDYTINSAYPRYGFTVDSNVNPDGKLSILVNTDNFNEPEEFIDIVLFGSPSAPGEVVWKGQTLVDEISYQWNLPRIKIINTTSGTTNIFAELDNTGGTEGNGEVGGVGIDTFTLSLKNKDDSEYIAEKEIVFPINFTPDLSVPEYLRAEITSDLGQPLPIEIVIPVGASSGSIAIKLPQEVEVDDQHEFYLATVMPPTIFDENINLPEPLSAKIIDDEGTFIVYYTIDESNLNLADGPGAGCCIYNIVEEGESIRFSFDAEKGAILNEEYKISMHYYQTGGHPESLDQQALEGEDFQNTASHQDFFDSDDNKTEVITSAVIDQNPDYNLSIKINADDDDLEKFTMILNSYSDNIELIAARFYDPDFLIVPSIEASITAEDDTASENPLTTAEFIVSLDIETPLDRPTTIFYELDSNSSADEEDFESLSGVLEIPGDKTFGSIIITPKNDDDVEDLESVIIRLLDKTGYSIKGSGVESINIISDDVAPVNAKIEATDKEAFEANISDTGEFTFSLNTPNMQADTKIDFEILSGANTDAQNSDYILLDENQQPLGDTRFVIIKAGAETVKIYVQAINDDESEIDEEVRIGLVSGVGYNVGSPSQAFVEIISSTFNENIFVPTSLRVTAQSAICASKDEGGILVENSSGFKFNVIVKKEDDESFKKESILEGNKNIPFNQLATGTYFVNLENLTNPELLVPSFTVQIKKLEAITADTEGVNLRTKTGTFTVSGSTSYKVSNGFKQYNYNFETTKTQTLSIPLENGINTVSIEGAATCQGKIQKQLFIDESYIYPNPTEGIINVLGLKLGEEFNIQIADSAGRVVFQETRKLQDEALIINILKFQAGLYFGKITSNNGPTVYFKVLKENK